MKRAYKIAENFQGGVGFKVIYPTNGVRSSKSNKVIKIEAFKKRIADILVSDSLACRDYYAKIPKLQRELDTAVERWDELGSVG
jgi:hypothetical protein